MKHADIFWVDYPFKGGHEQEGRRPSVIWHDLQQFPARSILVIPLTSRLPALRFRGCVRINPTSTNGLMLPSVAMIFQFTSIDVRRIGDYIGHLDDPDLLAIADIARQLQRL